MSITLSTTVHVGSGNVGQISGRASTPQPRSTIRPDSRTSNRAVRGSAAMEYARATEATASATLSPHAGALQHRLARAVRLRGGGTQVPRPSSYAQRVRDNLFVDGKIRTILLLAEPKESRPVLSPNDVGRLVDRGMNVVVERSEGMAGIRERCFKDVDYERAGATMVIPRTHHDADLVVSTKEDRAVEAAASDTVIAKNRQGRPAPWISFFHAWKALRDPRVCADTRANRCEPDDIASYFVRRGITGSDHELLRTPDGKRYVKFGRAAGACGTYLGLMGLAQRGCEPLSSLGHPTGYGTYDAMAGDLKALGGRRFDKPVVVGIMGSGDTAKGSEGVMRLAGAKEITAADLLARTEGQGLEPGLYVVRFGREARYRAIAETGLTREEALRECFDAEHVESDMEQYLPALDLLVNCTYFDASAKTPVLLTWDMLERCAAACGKTPVLADVTCDPHGSFDFLEDTADQRNPYQLLSLASGRSHHGPVDAVAPDRDQVACVALNRLPGVGAFAAQAATQFSARLTPLLDATTTRGGDPQARQILVGAAFTCDGEVNPVLRL